MFEDLDAHTIQGIDSDKAYGRTDAIYFERL